MRQNKLFKTTLLLLALAGGVSSAWADGTISIPQDLGSYILIGDGSTSPKTFATGVTLSGTNNVDGNSSTSYTIGSTNENTTATFALTVATEADFYFSFLSGAANCSSKMNLSLKNSSETEVWSKTGEEIEQTGGSWSLTQAHDFHIGTLTAGNYTLSISISEKTGSYAGNWGNFCFHTVSQYNTWPLLNESKYIDLSSGEYSGGCSGTDNIGSIRNGAAAEYMVYNSNGSANYFLHMGITYYGEGTMTTTIYDVATGTTEVNQTYDIPGISGYTDFSFPMVNAVSNGLKRVRFAFSGSGNASGYILNYKNVSFQSTSNESLDAWPLVGATTTYLDLSKWPTSGNPRYESSGQNLGYIYKNCQAIFYVSNEHETAYYNMHVNIPNYKDGGTLKLTVTDVATNTVETSNTVAITATGDYVMSLPAAISSGVKCVRFDFINDEASNWLYNVKNITFYKRSLNESYDYTAVAATGVDMVLTRSIAANSWSTIVLPFAMTSDQITSTFGDGTKVAQLTGISGNNLTFSSVTSMNANEPYMIRVPAAFSTATIEGVTVVAGTPGKTTVSGVDFIGSYDAVTEIPATDATYTYYFIKDNQLHKTAASGTANKMRGTRAYFKIPGTTAARLTGFTIDDESTGIETVHSSQFIVHSYYNLNGQRVAQPTRGLYIVNGKKVIIK